MPGRATTSIAAARWLAGSQLVAVALVWALLPGCAWMRNQTPDPAELAAARQFSRQGLDSMERGAWDQAGQCFAQAVSSSPRDEALRTHYASALWHQGDSAGAIRQMQTAVDLAREDAGLRVRLGEMHIAQRDFDSAYRAADQALQLDHQLAAAWALRGDVKWQQGQLQPALEDYHRALSLQEQFPRVQLAIAKIHHQLGRPQRALSTLQQLADQYPPDQTPAEVCYLEGLCYQSLQRHDDATAAFTSAARRERPNIDLLYRLAESQLLAGRPADARLVLDEALHLAPSHAPSLALQVRVSEAQRMMEAMLR